MNSSKNIKYRLFEFVLLDPKAVYEFPLIIEALGLDKGYILVKNENTTFGKQIEDAIPKESFSKNKRDEVLNLIDRMDINGQGKLNIRLGDKNSENSKERFLSDARALESKGVEPLCIMSDVNLGKYKRRRENEARRFLKKSMKLGKTPSYPREPEVVGLALKDIFTTGIFSNYVKFLSIVDPYVDIIGTHDEGPKASSERRDTLECIEKICADLTACYEARQGRNERSGNLQLNVFFKVKETAFNKNKFKQRFKDYVKSSKFGFFGGPKRKIELTFFGFSEKKGGQRFHLRWLFSNAFLINHSDGICSHNLRWNGKRSIIDNSEIIWSFTKTLDKDDLEITSADEENHPHASLSEFKKLYSHNSHYFDSHLKGWPAPIFEELETLAEKKLTEA